MVMSHGDATFGTCACAPRNHTLLGELELQVVWVNADGALISVATADCKLYDFHNKGSCKHC